MVQDGDPEQEMLVVQDELPQLNPEPEMGVAAAAAFDTSPPLLHQNPPPIPAETVHPSAPDMAQLFAMLAGMKGDLQQMNSKMDGNTQQMNGIKTDAKELKEEIKNNTNGIKEEMKDEMKKMRGEMQKMGHGLQAGTARMLAIAGQLKMATPRLGRAS